jgi:hypothetical protein
MSKRDDTGNPAVLVAYGRLMREGVNNQASVSRRAQNSGGGEHILETSRRLVHRRAHHHLARLLCPCRPSCKAKNPRDTIHPRAYGYFLDRNSRDCRRASSLSEKAVEGGSVGKLTHTNPIPLASIAWQSASSARSCHRQSPVRNAAPPFRSNGIPTSPTMTGAPPVDSRPALTMLETWRA